MGNQRATIARGLAAAAEKLEDLGRYEALPLAHANICRGMLSYLEAWGPSALDRTVMVVLYMDQELDAFDRIWATDEVNAMLAAAGCPDIDRDREVPRG